MAKNIQTLTALACACKAHRANNGYYNSTTRTRQDGPTNKALILTYLNDTTVLDKEDYELAEKVKQFFEGNIFKMLSGSLNPFEMTATKLVNLDTIPENLSLIHI